MTIINCINNPFSRLITPYIVGSDTSLYEYQSIQTAIAQAVTDGASAAIPKVILVSAGTFTEDVDILDGIIVKGMNSVRSIHASIIVGEISWGGTATGHIGSLEDIEVMAPAATDCLDVGLTGLGTLSCQSCKFDASAGDRCVNWATNAACFLRLNNCLLIGSTTESISIRGFGDFSMLNSRFENDGSSLQLQITQDARAFTFNCLLEGRAQVQNDAELTLFNCLIDYTLGTNNYAVRANTGSKLVAKGCSILSNNIGVSAVALQGGTGVTTTRCEMIQCELLSISTGGFAIEKAGAAVPDPTINKANLIGTGTATGIGAGITVVTYPTI